MDVVLRIRWVDQAKGFDLEFQREVTLDTLPATGDHMSIQPGDASERTVAVVVEMDRHLPVVVLNTVYADTELPHSRDGPSDHLPDWHEGFRDIAT